MSSPVSIHQAMWASIVPQMIFGVSSSKFRSLVVRKSRDSSKATAGNLASILQYEVLPCVHPSSDTGKHHPIPQIIFGVLFNFHSLVVRTSRDVSRPRDFRSQLARNSRDFLRPRDFPTLAVQKSLDFFRPRDFRSQVVRKFRDVLRQQDFRSVVVRKSCGSFRKGPATHLCLALTVCRSYERKNHLPDLPDRGIFGVSLSENPATTSALN